MVAQDFSNTHVSEANYFPFLHFALWNICKQREKMMISDRCLFLRSQNQADAVS